MGVLPDEGCGRGSLCFRQKEEELRASQEGLELPNSLGLLQKQPLTSRRVVSTSLWGRRAGTRPQSLPSGMHVTWEAPWVLTASSSPILGLHRHPGSERVASACTEGHLTGPGIELQQNGVMRAGQGSEGQLEAVAVSEGTGGMCRKTLGETRRLG